MAETLSVQIPGLEDFRKTIRVVDRKLSSAFDRELRTAADPIRDKARAGYYQHSWQRVTGKSIQGIKSATKRGAVALTLGDARRPYLLGQEFGAGPEHPQFPPFLGPEGRFFFPAYHAGVEEIEERVGDAMGRAVKVLQDRLAAGAI